MRHRTSTVSVLLLLGVSLVCGGWAPAAKPGSRPQVIRLAWVQTSVHISVYRSSWTSQLRNKTPQFGKPAGAKVGSELGFSDGSRTSGAITLPGGVLEYGGAIKHHGKSPGLVFPVTGGAGTYAGATGTYTLVGGDQAHAKNALLVLRLRYR